MNTIKVLLVEDEPFWQENLKRDLSREIDIEVVGIVSTKEDAITASTSKEIDVILMDIHLTRHYLEGIEAIKEISRLSNSKIIMLTSSTSEEVILQSFEYGAENYITKSNYQDIVGAVREAYRNQSSIHPDVADVLRNGFRDAKREIKLQSLTPEERKVFELRVQGYNKPRIAEQLHKSIHTVKNQLRNIRDKLNM
ncbi:MAG: response regulator transcription factor [Paenibacillaceae bacterium]